MFSEAIATSPHQRWAAFYALSHGGLPPARVNLVLLPSGHSPFDEDELRGRFASDIYSFIQAATVDTDAAEGQSQ